jgi:hypothetical protein
VGAGCVYADVMLPKISEVYTVSWASYAQNLVICNAIVRVKETLTCLCPEDAPTLKLPECWNLHINRFFHGTHARRRVRCVRLLYFALNLGHDH